VRSIPVTLAVILVSGGGANAEAQRRATVPDVLLVDGKVFTSDSTLPWAEAIAIRGDRIVAVGTTTVIRALAGPTTQVLELGGRVVLPGFNDAHDHVSGGSPGLFLSDSTPTAERSVKRLMARYGPPPGARRPAPGFEPSCGRRRWTTRR
jgi:hypothetical protein